MKRLFVLTGMFLILFFTGCEENQLTQPDATLDKVSDIPSGDWIKICCPVLDPTHGMCSINGRVNYKITRITGAYPTPVVQKSAKIKLMLDMDAILCDLKKPIARWIISGHSEDEFVFTDDGIKSIAKTYKISKRNDILLRVVYEVSTSGVTINKLYLRRIG
ncbi:MAG: hypothetical protein EHM47_05390 [Ignavibacteriales bacterium]|nr:MAG: hypothetical protein EHM47_05390 [Ignavibacteriales bacterium]